MTTTFLNTGTYVVETCCKCSVAFALNREMYDQRQRDKEYFYCPNGHAQHYTTSTEQRLRRKLDEERAEHQVTSGLLEYTKRSRAALKGHVTRVKNRVANGQCPCCRATFPDLAEHMADKHPDWSEEV